MARRPFEPVSVGAQTWDLPEITIDPLLAEIRISVVCRDAEVRTLLREAAVQVDFSRSGRIRSLLSVPYEHRAVVPLRDVTGDSETVVARQALPLDVPAWDLACSLKWPSGGYGYAFPVLSPPDLHGVPAEQILGEGLDVAIGPGAWVTGTVRSPDGAALPNVALRAVVSGSGHDGSLRADASGRFLFGAAPGSTGTLAVHVDPARTVWKWNAGDVLQLQVDPGIRLQVVDHRGSPVTRFALRLSPFALRDVNGRVSRVSLRRSMAERPGGRAVLGRRRMAAHERIFLHVPGWGEHVHELQEPLVAGPGEHVIRLPVEPDTGRLSIDTSGVAEAVQFQLTELRDHPLSEPIVYRFRAPGGTPSWIVEHLRPGLYDYTATVGELLLARGTVRVVSREEQTLVVTGR